MAVVIGFLRVWSHSDKTGFVVTTTLRRSHRSAKRLKRTSVSSRVCWMQAKSIEIQHLEAIWPARLRLQYETPLGTQEAVDQPWGRAEWDLPALLDPFRSEGGRSMHLSSPRQSEDQ